MLVRLSPAVPQKTRGNAAVAVHTDIDADRAFEIAVGVVEELAVVDDEGTHPGVVVAPGVPEELSSRVSAFTRQAVREPVRLADAVSLVDRCGFRSAGWKSGRGRIGALAAVGATAAFADSTVECIAYREPGRWGTPREVGVESVFEAAEYGYPGAWDTVDRGEREAVCVPHTPGPVLYGIRGDDPAVVRGVADRIECEPVAHREVFVTNQGTDAHLQPGVVGRLVDGRAYRVIGTVVGAPETRRGGHVFFRIADGDAAVGCVAFEPTKRFRDRVRALRVGDRVTVCGEVGAGSVKLEKFAVRALCRTERVVPVCGACGRRMESAGAGQGYRCRSCRTYRPAKATRVVGRDLEIGWYEVPPCARRHIAKPLVRGGFDAPVHPER